MNTSSLIPLVIDQSILIRFIIAVMLGAFIGAEREMIQQRLKMKEFGGIRSFMFVAILGFLSSYLSSFLTTWFVLIVFIVMALFVCVGYVYEAFNDHKIGFTSEISALVTFFVGILAYYDYSIAILVGIVTVLILSVKTPLHTFITKIKDEEFFATIEFALLSFVILPLLPNRTIDQWNIFNPYEIWLLIIFMLGISFVGYIFTRAIGTKKGTLITGIIGAIISSTAVTQSMSVKSKTHSKLKNILLASILAANGVMFVRIFFVVAALNYNMLPSLILPLGIMFCITLVQIYRHIFLLRKEKKDKESFKEEDVTMLESPFKLMPALKFGLFFVGVLFITEFAKIYLGTQGVYLTAFLAGIADVDPLILSMIKISFQDPAFTLTATKAITIAVISNIFVKGIIPFLFGERKFAWAVFKNLIITALAGIMIIVFL